MICRYPYSVGNPIPPEFDDGAEGNSSSDDDDDNDGEEDDSGDDDNEEDDDNRSSSSSFVASRTLEQIAERLGSCSECALFLHPTRYSMMVWVMDAESQRIVEESEDGYLDDGWTPRMVLGHEFSLLPFMYPHGYPNHKKVHSSSCIKRQVQQPNAEEEEEEEETEDRLLLSMGCPNVQDIQGRIFNLGFGPLPYYRRPGVLVHLSPAHKHHEDADMFQLGVIVSHMPGVHGCKYGCCDHDEEDADMEEEEDGSQPHHNHHSLQHDERCYFCQVCTNFIG